MNLPTVLAPLLAASLLAPLGGSAHRKTEEGNEHYLDGDLDLALAAYTEAQVAAPDAAELHYDIGNVLYRQGDYAGAADAFERALVSAGPGLRPRAAYNLGNAQFQQQEFSKAADSYRRALEDAPADQDAKRNLELALRALEEQPRSDDQQQQDDQEREQNEQQRQEQQERQGPQGPSQEQQQQEKKQQEHHKAQEPKGQQQQPAEGGSSPSPSPEGDAGKDQKEMTPEQAARLLDAAADAERDARRQEAERAARAGERSREKDW